MPRVGGKRSKSKSSLTPIEKTRTHKEIQDEDYDYLPKSKVQASKELIGFIIKRGRVNKQLKELTQDFRALMYPNTAMNLHETGKNNLKDFLSVAGVFGVTHMMIFT